MKLQSLLGGFFCLLLVIKAYEWKTYMYQLLDSMLIFDEFKRMRQQKKAYVEILLNAFEQGVILVDEEWNVLRMNQIALTQIDEMKLGKKIQTKHLKYVTYPIADLGWIILLQDQTKQIELETAKNQLISNVSHELRTPLFHIKSLVETLEDYEHVLTKDEKVYSLQMIQKETDRLTRLVNHVLDLSKLENVVYDLNAVDIRSLIYEAVQAVSKDIKIECEKDLPLVKAHRDLLWQALCNLLANAVKFSYGQIVVRAFVMPNHQVRIEVSDEGIGIDEAYHEAVFERFWRVENQVHTLEGTGLGLSLVKSIINKHQSEIWVNSVLNVGSSFWFDLYDIR